MASYSAFFSSGLLAPMHAINGLPKTPSKDKGENAFSTPYGDSSPIRPASPLPSLNDSPKSTTNDIMDIDYDDHRESTPTQSSVSTSLAAQPKPPTQQPRLRRRRSSLTIGTSPMTSIRSPTRNVGVAMQFQRHMAGSGSRSRSGSVTAPIVTDNSFGMFANIGLGSAGAVASEGTSLMGRLRSGSVGSHFPRGAPPALPSQQQQQPTAGPSGRFIRRHVRRVTSSVPAPAPPPSAPLPAVPALPPMSGMMRATLSYNRNTDNNTNSDNSKGGFKGRDRGLSVCSSVGRIDEEMKEN